MYRVDSQNYYLLKIILIFIVCCGLISCIPGPNIYHGDPFQDSINSITAGVTSRSEVHSLLGEPYVNILDWDVEVYIQRGEYASTMLVPPMYGSFSTNFYALIVYDDDGFVKALDSSAGGSNADGFRLLVYGPYEHTSPVLLAPKHGHINTQITNIDNNECALYIIPDGGEELYLNNKRVKNKFIINKGYYLVRLAPGKHVVRASSVEESKSINVICEAGKFLYLKITSKYFFTHKLESGVRGVGLDIELVNTPPNEILERQLIIYPALHDVIEPYEPI